MKLVTIFLLVISSFTAAHADLKDQIVAKEREELTALKAGDYKTFADLIADDALFLDPHGPGTKAEVVEHVSDFKLLEFTMEDIHFIPLSASSGIVAYKLTQKGSSHGHEFTTTVFASATWEERKGKWVCVFSQETPARKQ
jgi:ketosteroid isomerase-like protein